ncbi:M15 family metallopeptidase [Dehalobacter sp. DCM]|uniref:M15 family metallopeptidase n=1 Tax=Dehalobacter sp. DCM TaxID=2907827 RepID=UPI0030815ECE|nr:M15 family metallopeptidase [Dehalobacter sp. DCM]
MKKTLILIGIIITLFTSGCNQTTATDTPNSSTNVNTKTNPNTDLPSAQDNPQNTQSAIPVDTFLLRVGAAAQGTIDYHDVNSIAVLVNKQNDLPADYVPSDLVNVNIPFTFKEQAPKRMLRQEAATKLEELFSAAKEQNIILYGVSGYRSYQTQEGLFANFVRRYGSEEKANQISAKPGQSEHQTGLAMDVTSQSVNFGLEETFGATDEFSWLIANAHRFGFIIRYPKGKEYLTEYTYEPWHLRYVGVELASTLYKQNITFEEYLFFKI